MYKLYNGDCLEVMKDIPDGSVDMILCDLPYGTTACSWDTIIPFEPLWEHYHRLIKDNGVIALFSAQPFTTKLIYSNMKNYRYNWYWVKNTVTGFQYARYQPMRKVEDVCIFYKTNSEYIGSSKDFEPIRNYLKSEREKTKLTSKELKNLLGNNMGSHYFTNGVQWTLPNKAAYEKLQTTGYFKKSYDELLKEYNDIKSKRSKSKNISITYNPQGLKKVDNPRMRKPSIKEDSVVKGETLNNPYATKYTNWPNNVLNFNKEFGYHPTQKPTSLLEYLIKTYTNENELVLDNCMGSGSTGVAALNTNRRFIGIEKEEKYFNVARERIEQCITH